MSYLSKVRSSQYARSIFAILGSSVLAQVSIVILTPFLSRLYSPEDFGIFTTFQSLVSFLMFFSVCYDLAIPLPKKIVHGAILTILSLFLCVSFLIIGQGIGFFYFTFVKDTLGPLSLSLFTLVMTGAFISSLNKVLVSWLTRKNEFHRVAWFRLAGGIYPILQLCLVFIYPNEKGLLYGYTLALLAQVLLLSFWAYPSIKPYWSSISMKGIRLQAKRQSAFPLYQLPCNLVNAGSQALPAILLTSLYSAAITGYYGLGLRVLNLPVNLVNQSLRQVFYQKACENHHSGKGILDIYSKTTVKLALAGAIPFLLVFLFGKSLVIFIFGAHWAIAGDIIKIILPWNYLLLINGPSVMACYILKKQKFLFKYEISLSITRVLSLVLPWWLFNNYYYSIAFFAAIGMVFNAFLICYVYLGVRKYERFIYSR